VARQRGKVLIYAFDRKTRDVADTLKPWLGADMVRAHGVSRNDILVASCNDQIALAHALSREVLYIGAFPTAIRSKLQREADGKSCCLADDFFEWDFEENCLKARALAGRNVPHRVVADATSVYRLRLGVRR